MLWFQTNYMHLDYDLALVLTSSNRQRQNVLLLVHWFTSCINYWKDCWCRLKKYLLCTFRVAMHLPHSTVKRDHCGILMAQSYNIVSFIISTTTVQCSSLWIA